MEDAGFRLDSGRIAGVAEQRSVVQRRQPFVRQNASAPARCTAGAVIAIGRHFDRLRRIVEVPFIF